MHIQRKLLPILILANQGGKKYAVSTDDKAVKSTDVRKIPINILEKNPVGFGELDCTSLLCTCWRRQR